MRRRRVIAAVAAALVGLVLLPAGSAGAAKPEALSLAPERPALTWSGRRFERENVQRPDACAPGKAGAGRCDHLRLSLDTDPEYWTTRSGGVTVAISWPDAADDFDVYAYDGSKRLVGIAASSGTTGEQLYLARPTGTYEIRVVPVAVAGSGYQGSATLAAQDADADGEGDGDTSSFVYGPDQSNWYWKDQLQTEGTLPGGLGVPVRLPSPQAADTLPVAVRGGRQVKSSAVDLDLASRGVSEGTEIERFTLTIREQRPEEAVGSLEEPPVRHGAGAIKACPILELWGPGEAELWSLRPSADTKHCAQGVRLQGDQPAWTFDLTEMARVWADDPATALGVLLLGSTTRGGPSTWQINLKLPERDDPATPENEYQETLDRVAVEVVVARPEVPQATPPPPAPAATPAPFVPPATSTTPFTGPGTGASFDTTSEGFVASDPAPEGDERTLAVEPVATVPRMPWYAWALMPFALAAVAAARAAIVDYAGGTREDGAISAIRRRNQDARPGAALGGGPDAGSGRRSATTRALARLGRVVTKGP